MFRAVVNRSVLVSVSLVVTVTAGLLSVVHHEQRLVLGVAADDIQTFDDFTGATQAHVGLYVWYQAWALEPNFDVSLARAAVDRGALPIVTWEPWNPGRGVEQPQYSLAAIASGAHDAYISDFAAQVRDTKFEVGLRFIHELNGTFYPWGVGVNGNTAQDAVDAWRHVRHIFDQVGATNVIWIWSVNAYDGAAGSARQMYPGDDVVNWLGIDGYNAGDAQPWGGWRTPSDLFGQPIADLRAISTRPIAITETASAESGGDKALWIRQLFGLAVEQDLIALVWFDYDKEADWRVGSSRAALDSYRRAAASIGRR